MSSCATPLCSNAPPPSTMVVLGNFQSPLGKKTKKRRQYYPKTRNRGKSSAANETWKGALYFPKSGHDKPRRIQFQENVNVLEFQKDPEEPIILIDWDPLRKKTASVSSWVKKKLFHSSPTKTTTKSEISQIKEIPQKQKAAVGTNPLPLPPKGPGFHAIVDDEEED